MPKLLGPVYRATNLEAVINERGLRFDWVAKQSKVSKSHLSMMMNGKRGASEAVATRIAETLGIPLFLLFDLSYEDQTISDEAAVA